ncbi:hypothetical protein HHI36_000244 [Cryptolaemus montrouzieri]|uniref:Uncharacterized protein n=1 Tax=Cryptolaemus montrouzieri TaxID=559131 RepID=A0ABD2P4N0_9CUCU
MPEVALLIVKMEYFPMALQNSTIEDDRIVNRRKKKSNGNTFSWISPDIVELKKRWLRYSEDQQVRDEYVRLKSEYKRRTELAKFTYYENKINSSSNKSKEVWNLVNLSLGRTKQKDSIQLNVDCEIVTDAVTIANKFGRYFSSISEEKLAAAGSRADNVWDTCAEVGSTNTMFFGEVSHEEVRGVLSGMRSKYSSGLDEVQSVF